MMFSLVVVIVIAVILGTIAGSLVTRVKAQSVKKPPPRHPPLDDGHYRASRVREETERLKKVLRDDEQIHDDERWMDSLNMGGK